MIQLSGGHCIDGNTQLLLKIIFFSCRISLGVIIGGALLYRTLRPRENKFALKIAAKQKAREINRAKLEAALTINGKVREPPLMTSRID